MYGSSGLANSVQQETIYGGILLDIELPKTYPQPIGGVVI